MGDAAQPRPEQYRARLGALALAAASMTPEERKAVIASRLPVAEWPEQPLLITASDAHTGEFTVFDRESGVELIDAVAASCAVPGCGRPRRSTGTGTSTAACARPPTRTWPTGTSGWSSSPP
ncbi:hypothetical protein ACFQY4_33020 [Catellatospora bangladeshensis]|uniref:hypothetical protein n=1 Tax=Catellatospora bangladeshensis TaxID=310355 RepID=UPI00360BC1D0